MFFPFKIRSNAAFECSLQDLMSEFGTRNYNLTSRIRVCRWKPDTNEEAALKKKNV